MNLPDAIRRIRRSTVVVAEGTVGSDDERRLGGGFLVGDGEHVLTAHHVIDGFAQDPTLDELRAGLPAPDISQTDFALRAAFIFSAVEVVAINRENDLALLRFLTPLPDGLQMSVNGKDYPITVEPVTFADRRPSAGDPIATSGFPLEEPSLVTTAGVLASDMTHDADQPGRERLLGDLNVNRGNSGGPVYAVKDAKVIGVCIKGRLALAETVTGPSSLGTMAGLCSIVPADVITDFLRASGVDPSSAPTPSGRGATSRRAKGR